MLAGSSPRSVASLGRLRGRRKFTKVEEREIRNLLRSKCGDDINYVIGLVPLRNAAGHTVGIVSEACGVLAAVCGVAGPP